MMHTCQRRLVLLLWVATVAMPMISTRAFGGDYTVHVVEPAVTNHMILQDGPLPPVCKKATTMKISACRGEYEAASFVVTASKSLEGVMVEVGPVSGPGVAWPADAVDIRVVKEIRRLHAIPGMVPTLLVHDDSFLDTGSSSRKVEGAVTAVNEAGFLVDAAAPPSGKYKLNGELRDTPELQPVNIAKRRQFWITVHVPGFAPPGNYKTTLRVVPNNAAPTELTLQIHVYPFELQSPMIEYSLYYPAYIVGDDEPNWRNGGKWSRITEEQYIAECKNMISHGVTNPNIYAGVGIRPDGTPDYSHIEKYLAAREKAGMGPWLPLYLSSSAAEPVSRTLTEDEKKDRIRIVREVKEWGRQRGYPDVYWIGLDEAWGDWMARERDSFQAIKDGGGKVFVATGVMFPDLVGDSLQCPVLMSPLAGQVSAAVQKYPADEAVRNAAKIASSVDLNIMNTLDVYQKCIDTTHRAGNKIFVYMNPPAGVPLPELQRRCEGLGLWRAGIDGTMTWAYIHIDGEPLNQTMGWSKAMRVEGGVLDTLYWEGFREGVDDVRYLTTLLHALSRAQGRFPGDPLVGETQAWLSKVDINGGDLDTIRREMARRIIALQDLGYKLLSAEEALATVDVDKAKVVAFPELWRFKLLAETEAVMTGLNVPDVDQGMREKWFDPATDDSQWSSVKVGTGYTRTAGGGWGNKPGFGWYRTEIPLTPKDVKRKFKYLYFEACDEDAWVYVNGKLVFEHSSETTGLLPEHIWLTPFVAPLADVKLRGNDLLAVRVMNRSDMGGIWKPVRLILSDQELTTQQIKALVETKTVKK